MIDVVVTFLKDHLNAALRTEHGEDLVVLPDGHNPAVIPFKFDAVTMMVFNIEQDHNLRAQRGFSRANPDGTSDTDSSIRVHLSILFIARFGDYTRAMGALSKVLQHFQNHPVFTQSTAPALDPRLGKLPVRLQPLSFAEQHEIWGALRIPSMPSLMYRVSATFPDKTEAPVILEVHQDPT